MFQQYSIRIALSTDAANRYGDLKNTNFGLEVYKFRGETDNNHMTIEFEAVRLESGDVNTELRKKCCHLVIRMDPPREAEKKYLTREAIIQLESGRLINGVRRFEKHHERKKTLTSYELGISVSELISHLTRERFKKWIAQWKE